MGFQLHKTKILCVGAVNVQEWQENVSRSTSVKIISRYRSMYSLVRILPTFNAALAPSKSWETRKIVHDKLKPLRLLISIYALLFIVLYKNF